MEKRAREGDDEAPSPEEVPAAGSIPNEQAQTGEGPASTPEDEADDQPLHKNFRMSSAVRTGADCPYLDTISRQNLDFDFEKCCSVSLSPVNVYACLVCGKYFQGRGPNTHAYTHSLDAGHHMFMKVTDGKVYCLPDMYQVVDRSLADIQYVLSPTFMDAEVARLDTAVTWARALDGTEFMPGLVGLNNMKRNDYANVVIQTLVRIVPIRDYFLRTQNYEACRSPLVREFGSLVRKMWITRAFKGHVSPHEFMQSVIAASEKRFTIDAQADAIDFFQWLVNRLHLELTGGKRKKASIITECLQGDLEVTTLAGTGKAKGTSEDVVDKVSFLMLGLDLPAAPLFKDALETVIIPQIPMYDLLRKYGGSLIVDDIKAGRRKFRLTKPPRFLALHVKRFVKNQFFLEKNPTIVNFPVKNLEVPVSAPGSEGRSIVKYDLLANIVHEGKAGEGSVRVHIHRKVENTWYEVQDLRVTDVLPQMVALSETYMQVYERQGP
ncbi:hypothetical protein ACKKBF_B39020 [Auxenochlorella protothecoides x Auxenochlorella symbiontica]